MRQVDVAEGKRPRDERFVGGIELALDPVRPDPVEIVLDRLRVHETAGMKQHAGSQELERLGEFRGFSEAPNFRHQLERVEKTVGSRRPSDQESHRPRFE